MIHGNKVGTGDRSILRGVVVGREEGGGAGIAIVRVSRKHTGMREFTTQQAESPLLKSHLKITRTRMEILGKSKIGKASLLSVIFRHLKQQIKNAYTKLCGHYSCVGM